MQQAGLQWQAFEGMGDLLPADVRMGRDGGELDCLFTPAAADLGPDRSEEQRALALRWGCPRACSLWTVGCGTSVAYMLAAYLGMSALAHAKFASLQAGLRPCCPPSAA